MSDAARLVIVREWSGKFVINESYRSLAKALAMKYSEIRHVPVDYILFVDNTEATGKNKNKFKMAHIAKIPDKWLEIVYQLTGKQFGYIMEFFKRNTQDLSREQIIAIVYHELRHIGKDGDLILHDIEDWANMHSKLGPDWTTTKSRIPDLLDDDVDWDNINRPNLFTILGPGRVE